MCRFADISDTDTGIDPSLGTFSLPTFGHVHINPYYYNICVIMHVHFLYDLYRFIQITSIGHRRLNYKSL